MRDAVVSSHDGLATDLEGPAIFHGDAVNVLGPLVISLYEAAETFHDEAATMSDAEETFPEAAMTVVSVRSATPIVRVCFPCSSCILCHEEGRGIAGNAMARPPFSVVCRDCPLAVLMSLF